MARIPLDFQVDTGFSGTLIIGEELFDPACGNCIGTMKAELADEHITTYDNYEVVIRWLDEEVLVQVLVGLGKVCLIGTDMLCPHRLEIDFGQRTVELLKAADW